MRSYSISSEDSDDDDFQMDDEAYEAGSPLVKPWCKAKRRPKQTPMPTPKPKNSTNTKTRSRNTIKSFRKSKDDVVHATPSGKEYITEKVSNCDVVMGRGTGVSNMPGNCKFRIRIDIYRQDYLSCERVNKSGIATLVVEEVLNSGGSFIEKQGDGDDYRSVPLPRAIEKTCQALREKRASDKYDHEFKKPPPNRHASSLPAQASTSLSPFVRSVPSRAAKEKAMELVREMGKEYHMKFDENQTEFEAQDIPKVLPKIGYGTRKRTSQSLPVSTKKQRSKSPTLNPPPTKRTLKILPMFKKCAEGRSIVDGKPEENAPSGKPKTFKSVKEVAQIKVKHESGIVSDGPLKSPVAALDITLEKPKARKFSAKKTPKPTKKPTTREPNFKSKRPQRRLVSPADQEIHGILTVVHQKDCPPPPSPLSPPSPVTAVESFRPLIDSDNHSTERLSMISPELRLPARFCPKATIVTGGSFAQGNHEVGTANSSCHKKDIGRRTIGYSPWAGFRDLPPIDPDILKPTASGPPFSYKTDGTHQDQSVEGEIMASFEVTNRAIKLPNSSRYALRMVKIKIRSVLDDPFAEINCHSGAVTCSEYNQLFGTTSSKNTTTKSGSSHKSIPTMHFASPIAKRMTYGSGRVSRQTSLGAFSFDQSSQYPLTDVEELMSGSLEATPRPLPLIMSTSAFSPHDNRLFSQNIFDDIGVENRATPTAIPGEFANNFEDGNPEPRSPLRPRRVFDVGQHPMNHFSWHRTNFAYPGHLKWGSPNGVSHI